MTDTEIIELLATKGMGWTKRLHEYSHRETWEEVLNGHSTFIDPKKWNPLTNRNAVVEIEARLTREQRHEYSMLLDEPSCLPYQRMCCEALVKVLHESSEEIIASMVAEGL